MAKKPIPSKYPSIEVNTGFLFKPMELFIQRSFVVRAIREFNISERDAECLFCLALFVNRTIIYIKNSGTPPGVPVYMSTVRIGEITLHTSEEK